MSARGADRLIGIVLGVLIGIAIVAIFVFVFSEDAVDAPQLDRGGSGDAGALQQPATKPAKSP